MTHAETRRDLDNVMLSDISQSQNPHAVPVPWYEISRIGGALETEIRLGVVTGWGQGRVGVPSEGQKASFQDDGMC